MLPDRVSNPGPLTYESGVLPIALRGPACWLMTLGQPLHPDNHSSHQEVAFTFILHFTYFMIFLLTYRKKEQSDQDLHCLPFFLHLLEAFLHCKIKLFHIKDNCGSWSGCPNT